MTELMTIEELATKLNCGGNTVRNMVKDGKIHCVRLNGRGVRFSSDEVRKYLEKNTDRIG